MPVNHNDPSYTDIIVTIIIIGFMALTLWAGETTPLQQHSNFFQ